MGFSLASVTLPWTLPSFIRLAQSGWAQEVLRRHFLTCFDDHHLEGIAFIFPGRMPYSMNPEEKPKPNHHRSSHLHRWSALLLSLPISTILASCLRINHDLTQEKMSVVMLLSIRESSISTHNDVTLFPGVLQDKLNKNTAVQRQYIQVNQS